MTSFAGAFHMDKSKAFVIAYGSREQILLMIKLLQLFSQKF